MPRITRDGNVIAADFGTRPTPSVNITFKTAVLYCDPHVCLIRIAYFLNGEVIGIQHVMQPINNMDVQS